MKSVLAFALCAGMLAGCGSPAAEGKKDAGTAAVSVSEGSYVSAAVEPASQAETEKLTPTPTCTPEPTDTWEETDSSDWTDLSETEDFSEPEEEPEQAEPVPLRELRVTGHSDKKDAAGDMEGSFIYYPSAPGGDGETYEDDVFGGAIADNYLNWNTYRLGGNFETFEGVLFWNEDAMYTTTYDVFFDIYNDDTGERLYRSANFTPDFETEHFSVDVTDVDYLRIVVNGKNYIRAAECYLSLVPGMSFEDTFEEKSGKGSRRGSRRMRRGSYVANRTASGGYLVVDEDTGEEIATILVDADEIYSVLVTDDIIYFIARKKGSGYYATSILYQFDLGTGECELLSELGSEFLFYRLIYYYDGSLYITLNVQQWNVEAEEGWRYDLLTGRIETIGSMAIVEGFENFVLSHYISGGAWYVSPVEVYNAETGESVRIAEYDVAYQRDGQYVYLAEPVRPEGDYYSPYLNDYYFNVVRYDLLAGEAITITTEIYGNYVGKITEGTVYYMISHEGSSRYFVYDVLKKTSTELAESQYKRAWS